MTDYGALDNRALDRLIAERSGLRAEPAPPMIVHYYGKDIPFSTGFDEYYIHVSWRHEPIKIEISKGADVWEYILNETEWIPTCSTDANAALVLWDTIPDEYTPRLVRILVPVNDVMARWYKAATLHNETMEQIEALDADIARAISIHWLLWKDATDGA
jgi:hypothetical protein